MPKYKLGDVVLVSDPGGDMYTAYYLQRAPDDHLAVVTADDLGPILAVIPAETVEHAPLEITRECRLNSQERAALRRMWKSIGSDLLERVTDVCRDCGASPMRRCP